MHSTIKQSSKGRRNRSAVTSRRRLFAEHTSTSSPRGRRFIDLVRILTDDRGGNDRISETTRNIIRRIAFLTCVLEDCEADYVRTGATTLDERLEYQRLSNTQSRLMKKIGLLSTPSKPDDDDEIESPLEYATHGGSRKSHRERLSEPD